MRQSKLTKNNSLLPRPDPEARTQSEKLSVYIRDIIDRQEGAIGFDEYMDLVLYHPSLGYYSSDIQKFGPKGDFVTAPQISPFFSKCLASQCRQILGDFKEPSILEIGAGDGIMARDLLLNLEKHNSLPDKYYILEVSADLKLRQKQLLKQSIPQYIDNIIWLNSIYDSNNFEGLVLANEVLDALPVKRFKKESNSFKEQKVTFYKNNFCWIDADADCELIDNLTEINEIVDFLDNETLVISFDYESHNKLLEQNITHTISENFLIDVNIESLQKIGYEFLEWSNLISIKDKVSFLGINIPQLYNDQLIHSIIKIVKKFSELENIFNNFSNVHYYASGDLFLIIKQFTEQASKILNEKNDEFYFDKIKIGTNLGTKNISLSISSSSYNSIKNIGEKIIRRTLNQNDNFSGSSTLVVELNTKLFENLFLESRNFNKNLLYYGRRRPAVWDVESYSIMKNSNCKILTSNLLSKNEFEKYHTEILSFKENFIKSITENTELDKFFRINEISLSSIIIPKIKQLIESKIEKSIFEILLTEKVFKKYQLDSVIIISEIGMTEQIVIQFANSLHSSSLNPQPASLVLPLHFPPDCDLV